MTDLCRLIFWALVDLMRARVTRSQWQVLAYLAQNEGINQSGLADLLEIEPITLGRIVDKLQILGLIERRPDPSDRRVWLLHLTPAAHPKPTQLRRLGEATRGEALAGVAEADIARGSLFGGRQGGVPDDVTGVLEIAGWLKEWFEFGPEWLGGGS